MKIALISILALVTVALGATMPQKAVIISYPDDTPNSVIQQAMDAIRDAGGMITHEYKLIKGFAANAPAKVLQTVQTFNTEYKATVEEDQIVTVVGNGD